MPFLARVMKKQSAVGILFPTKTNPGGYNHVQTTLHPGKIPYGGEKDASCPVHVVSSPVSLSEAPFIPLHFISQHLTASSLSEGASAELA